MGEPVGLSVPANTLVIANTHGFHRRGDAQKRSMRTEIWSISRSNPFNRDYCDTKAAKNGVQSSWHIVDARNTLNDSSAQIQHQHKEAA